MHLIWLTRQQERISCLDEVIVMSWKLVIRKWSIIAIKIILCSWKTQGVFEIRCKKYLINQNTESVQVYNDFSYLWSFGGIKSCHLSYSAKVTNKCIDNYCSFSWFSLTQLNILAELIFWNINNLHAPTLDLPCLE